MKSGDRQVDMDMNIINKADTTGRHESKNEQEKVKGIKKTTNTSARTKAGDSKTSKPHHLNSRPPNRRKEQ